MMKKTIIILLLPALVFGGVNPAAIAPPLPAATLLVPPNTDATPDDDPTLVIFDVMPPLARGLSSTGPAPSEYTPRLQAATKTTPNSGLHRRNPKRGTVLQIRRHHITHRPSALTTARAAADCGPFGYSESRCCATRLAASRCPSRRSACIRRYRASGCKCG